MRRDREEGEEGMRRDREEVEEGMRRDREEGEEEMRRDREEGEEGRERDAMLEQAANERVDIGWIERNPSVNVYTFGNRLQKILLYVYIKYMYTQVCYRNDKGCDHTCCTQLEYEK